MKLKYLIVLVFACGLATGCKTVRNPAVIPGGEVATAPSSDTPAEFAEFSGLWAGKWGKSLDGKLLVQTIESDGNVRAIYAWGDEPNWNITAGNRQVDGRITANTLDLEKFSNGAVVRYEMQPNGTLAGFYELNNQITKGTFVRQ
jgi:hypothetical protein